MSDNRPARYVEADAATGRELVVYRASGLGGCARAMVAAARGEQPRPHQQWFQDVLDEGTRMEAAILDQFATKAGVVLTDTQPEVELEIGVVNGRRVIVRGHMDAIGAETIGGQMWVVEAKKFRPSTYPGFARQGVMVNGYYPWQLSVYMLATGLPAKFVGSQYDPVLDSIVGVDWHTYMDPPVSMSVITARIADIEAKIAAGYGADEVECSNNYPCPYWYLHDEKVGPYVLPATDEVAEIIVKWRELAEWIKQEEAIVSNLQASKKELAEKLRQLISSEGVPADIRAFAATVGDAKFSIAWTKTHVAEKVTKGYDLDYFTVKEVSTSKSRETRTKK